MLPSGRGTAVFFCTANVRTVSASALATGFCPTTATGAPSQRPTQGTRCTRKSFSFSSAAINFSHPANSQLTESQTRTVTAGGAAAPSLTTSK